MCLPTMDPALTEALTSLGPAGVFVGHRVIVPGDEEALLPSEIASFERCVLKVRRQSGAARSVARSLLRNLGFEHVSLPRLPSGGLAWPPGTVGSISHDQRVAVAAVARVGRVIGLGIDIEPAEPLPPDLVTRVATSAECARYSRTVLESRLLFCSKEAIYKAVNPVDGMFLDFHDIEIDLAKGCGCVRNGRNVQLAVITMPRIVALAHIAIS
jgi:4'-phosphopantetheinyl transferase EntD